MEKPRILITDESEVALKILGDYLQETFDVVACNDAQQLLTLVCEFEPDVLILDMYLPSCDVFDIIRTIRTSGKLIGIIATTRNNPVYITERLNQLDVVHIVRKPFKYDAVMSCIYAAINDYHSWGEEIKIQCLLSTLGFQIGINRSGYVIESILRWYESRGACATKQIYLELAQAHYTTASAVEKAIRDAIHYAWNHSQRDRWRMYFETCNIGRANCPSNEIFIARIAQCLLQNERCRLPYVK